VGNEPHGGRPSVSVNAERISKVKQLVHANWHLTIRLQMKWDLILISRWKKKTTTEMA
jgi:hypothetical protein